MNKKNLTIISLIIIVLFLLSCININVECKKIRDNSSVISNNIKLFLNNSYSQLYCVAPSNAVVGQPIHITIQAWDWAERICKKSFHGSISFSSTDTAAILPGRYSFKILDGGIKTFEDGAIFNTPGIHYVIVNDTINDIWAISNPIKVTEKESEYKWYWGDLHFQSANSDGSGTPMNTVEYARDKSMLDFCCLTDHDTCWDFKLQLLLIKTIGWLKAKIAAEKFYEPDNFVTLLGYEYTNYLGDGHYNVYYNTVNDAKIFAVGEEQYSNVNFLWQQLKNWKNQTGFDVFTIPHHPLWTWNVSLYDKEMVPLIEIFQYRGSSEMRNDQGNPIPYTKEYPENSTGTVQNGLAKGYKMGLMASSDDHTGHPGHAPYLRAYLTEPLCYIGPIRFIPKGFFENQSNPWYLGFYNKINYYKWLLDPKTVIETDYPNGGLTGVYAKGLTREEIFNALKDRRCVAVTNQNRMIVDFTVNDHSVGNDSEVFVKDINTPRIINVSVAGTAPIKNITVVKNNATFYYSAEKGNNPLNISNYKVSFSITDYEPIKGINYDKENGTDGRDFYYLRIIQSNNWAGWIGPIWVNPLNKT